MKVLLHICCGPCATSTVTELRELGHDVTGLFYNPNIHPYREFAARLDAAKRLARDEGFDMICGEDYGLRDFLHEVRFDEDDRCGDCWRMRLTKTAEIAHEKGFDAFTTTLLISPHQDHEMIKKIAEGVSEEVGVSFLYHDFRPGFKKTYELSRDHDLYRQKYCGCIFSEYERFGPEKEK